MADRQPRGVWPLSCPSEIGETKLGSSSSAIVLARGGALPVEPRLCHVLGAGLDVIAVQHVGVAPFGIADVERPDVVLLAQDAGGLLLPFVTGHLTPSIFRSASRLSVLCGREATNARGQCFLSIRPALARVPRPGMPPHAFP